MPSLEDSDSDAEAYLTDDLDSPIEFNFDDSDEDSLDDHNYENNGDNLDGSSYEEGKYGNYNSLCNTEILKDFTYKAEGTIYEEGHAIRLIRLVYGTGPIHACLFKAFIRSPDNELNAMPYDALSYTWDNPDKTKQMILNGERFMVTENLYSALQYIRSRNEDRILWIDAICIDQSQILERNHQVSHMASIYRDAERVLFWLGEPTFETNLLMSSLKRLEARASTIPNITRENARDKRWQILWEEEKALKGIHGVHEGLVLLLGRPWFQRSWILQEVCFANTGIVTCGAKSIAARMFTLAPWLLNYKPEAHCEVVLGMMPGVTRSTLKFLSGREMRNLYTLLRRFHRSKAGDPRDQVFALLNMATDSHMARFPKVEYKKKFKEVLDSVYAYLFPKSWDRCGRSHSYQELSRFVEDFPGLRAAEIDGEADDMSKGRLSEFANHDLQKTLRKAIESGNAQFLQDLLRFSNIDLNKESTAAVRGFADIVALLLKSKAGVDFTDQHARTLLSWAAEIGHEAVVKLLLANKAKVDLKDKFHRTPLSYAAEHENGAVVGLLLASKADVNSKNRDEQTPLSIAVENGRWAIVELLLATGRADVDARNNKGQTPLWIAVENGHRAIAYLLLAIGKAGIYGRNNKGQTLLTLAVKGDHEAIFKTLYDQLG